MHIKNFWFYQKLVLELLREWKNIRRSKLSHLIKPSNWNEVPFWATLLREQTKKKAAGGSKPKQNEVP